MKKTMRVGTINTGNGRRANIYISATFEDGNLSISGVIGPLSSGNALGGCGQIDMEFQHRHPEDNDKRYEDHLTRAQDINFAKGWDREKWFNLLDIWKKYHLNDKQAACEHQRELGWRYEDHHDSKTFRGEACPVCGYEIGSAWLRINVPKEVIELLEALPETDKQPAWV